MRKQLISPFFIFFIFFLLHSSISSSQTPSPAPSGPTNITAILEKGGQFTTLIRLMKSTQEADQINTQLNSSIQGLTIFAPTDNAFANLKPGILNSLSDQQKVQLVQFHVIPNFLSTSTFQTVSNPLRTQAGNSANGEFPMNVTTSGNQVNITTGVNAATVANTMYTDGQLAVYQVDQVLLPLDIFGAAAAPAPAPTKPEKDTPDKSPPGTKEDASVDTSAATTNAVSITVMLVAAISLKLCVLFRIFLFTSFLSYNLPLL